MSARTEDGRVDVLGVGLGPSNLALAGALGEMHPRASALFLERQPRVSWHPGMMLEGARVQINVHKDLATPRNPRSELTFLNYLHDQGRLLEFLSLGTMCPSRVEYDAYLRWAATRIQAPVLYGRRVIGLEIDADREGFLLAADREDGSRETHRARAVVLAPGGEPTFPRGTSASRRVVHSSRYAMAMRELEATAPPRAAPRRLMVVGAGQSAAEVFSDMLARDPEAEVRAVLRGLAYRSLEDHASLDRAFFPAMKAELGRMSEASRAEVRAMWSRGNYGVVDDWLIQQIYERLYQESVVGKRRARVVPLRELVAIDDRSDRGGGVTVRSRSVVDGTEHVEDADLVVLATGYDYRADHPLLEGLGDAVLRDGAGRPRIDESYRVALAPGLRADLFLSGRTEELHGPGEPLLSMTALRAGAIASALITRSRTFTSATEPRATHAPLLQRTP